MVIAELYVPVDPGIFVTGGCVPDWVSGAEGPHPIKSL